MKSFAPKHRPRIRSHLSIVSLHPYASFCLSNTNAQSFRAQMQYAQSFHTQMQCVRTFVSQIVKVPGMGDKFTEGNIVEWRVKEGQAVTVNDIVAVIETDKFSADIRTPKAGVVVKQHAKVGDITKSGADLFTIDTEGTTQVEMPTVSNSSKRQKSGYTKSWWFSKKSPLTYIALAGFGYFFYQTCYTAYIAVLYLKDPPKRTKEQRYFNKWEKKAKVVEAAIDAEKDHPK